MDNGQPQYTTALAIMSEALAAYLREHQLDAWMASWVEIATPGQPRWQELSRRGTGLLMGGDPVRSEIALCREGRGQFYGCVEAAIADLRAYFCDEEEGCGTTL